MAHIQSRVKIEEAYKSQEEGCSGLPPSGTLPLAGM